MKRNNTPKYLLKFFSDTEEGTTQVVEEVADKVANALEDAKEIDLDKMTAEEVDQVVDTMVEEATTQMQSNMKKHISSLRTKLRARLFSELENGGIYPEPAVSLEDQDKEEKSVVAETKKDEAEVATQSKVTKTTKKFDDSEVEEMEVDPTLDPDTEEMEDESEQSLEDGVNDLL